MIPFHPKFGSAEDAPNYRLAESDDKCENCAHYRNLGPRGFCEKFSFMCQPESTCDDFRPAGVVKESAASPYLAMSGLGAATMGGKSLYDSRKKLMQDRRLVRAGIISDQELQQRKKEYLSDAALSGTLGAAGGAGLTFGAKRVAMPAIRSVAEDVADIAGRRADKVVDAMDETLKANRAGFKADMSDLAGENLENLRDAFDPLGVHRRKNAKEAEPVKRTLRERIFGARPRTDGE